MKDTKKSKYMTRAVILTAYTALIILFTISCESKQPEPKVVEKVNFPDMQLDSSEIVFSVEGQREAILWAEKIDRYLEENQIRAHKVKVDFDSEPPEGHGVLLADSGYVKEKSNLVELFGNISLTTERGTKLVTTNMLWNTKNNVIYSDAHVRVTRDGNWLEGDGYRTDVGFNNFTILKNIRGNLSL